MNCKTGAFESLTLCSFYEEHVFNSPRKNTTHKSGENKKEARRNTQSASRRASGILRSCEMCKSQQKTFSLIFRAVGYRKRRCHPHAQHIIPLIYLRHSVYLSPHRGAFLIGTQKGRNGKIDRKKRCIMESKRKKLSDQAR